MKKKYGHWSVIRTDKRHYYLCRCKCGTEKLVYKYNLTSGKSRSCGCQNQISIEGKRFGNLVCIRRTSNIRVLCRCDCGTQKEILIGNLRQHGTKSCGCMRIESNSKAHITHGLTKSTEYRIWYSMIVRCYSEKHISYRNHGGRGISVCNRWRSNFQNFIDDMGCRPTNKHTLERIDNNSGYSPENCRWATYKEQQNNKRNNVILIHGGESMTITQWGEKLGIGDGIIWKRLKRGWPVKKALFTPSLTPNRPRQGKF